MTDKKREAAALRDECERRAKVAEARMIDPSLSPEDRAAASDEAKVYWQLRGSHADTVAYAELARPTKFTAKNTGPSVLTIKRAEFLRTVAERLGTFKRDRVCLAAMNETGFADLFQDYEAAYRFARPSIFDGIRKPPKPSVG